MIDTLITICIITILAAVALYIGVIAMPDFVGMIREIVEEWRKR